ncbi:hypothetical protein BJ986_003171 [Phycicoccus badiiscoriae]|uniref:DUF4349 domain-containing protein n=1 Tax=Pedococcus badiiscoriae TaxID=642776 RepID=A0A852WP78_9MICO|nr:DUF4349 domain-containing protein [Pedococcus badiiscoriae]NYG08684.1 hypothetical protein [Pedococcus badiiscoriae]
MFPVSPHRSTAAIGAALLATLALAACGGGGSSTSSAHSAASVMNGANESVGRGASVPSAVGAPAGGDSAKPAAGAGTGVTRANLAANLAATQDSLARRATIALQVTNIGQAVAKVRATTAAAQGIVLSENVGTTNSDVPLVESSTVTATTYAEITISVPSSELDGVLSDLGSVGTVIRSTSSSEDVGAQIVDTASRLDTMRASVERVRAFLQSAKDLTQIVTLEAELTRRQSDLEALEAQLASLKGSVARSPVQISLTTEPNVIVVKPHEAGFLAGLKSGWDAFTGSATVLLTIVGAVVPFLVVVALIGLPVWWYLRRRRVATPPPAVLPQ